MHDVVCEYSVYLLLYAEVFAPSHIIVNKRITNKLEHVFI